MSRTVSDFGRVGHIVNDRSNCTFMVVGQHPEWPIRNKKPAFRTAIVLDGYGQSGVDMCYQGDIGAINLDDDQIEWLDD